MVLLNSRTIWLEETHLTNQIVNAFWRGSGELSLIFEICFFHGKVP